MVEIIGIRFKRGQGLLLLTGDIKVETGQHAIVETSRGLNAAKL